ncbi:MAG: hypothetical protein HRK26_02895 [Rickettsiaceae bacterium H1]|nr:hypothetical protein [Rickettsiaceae bacterium H1]
MLTINWDKDSVNTQRKKKYLTEFVFALAEITAKGFVVMLNFLYGKGKISDISFILTICLIQFIGSGLFMKVSIYDRSKISNKLNSIRFSFKQSDEKREYGFGKDKLIFGIMILLQMIYVLGTSLSPFLYKKEKLDISLYMFISIFSFILGVVPTVILRRISKVNDEITCDEIIQLISKKESEIGQQNGCVLPEISCDSAK